MASEERGYRGYASANIEKMCEGPSRQSVAKPQTLLDISKSIQAYIDSNGWSWCDMDRVYKILKTING